MISRSHTSRWDSARQAPLIWAALAGIVGCQSNSQRDWVARERRAQEDQIYAMEDYIAQYQQLLCQVRSENAALKRQMSDGYLIEENAATRPSTRSAPRSTPRNGGSPAGQGPAIDAPPAQNPDRTQPAPLNLPDVPALEETIPSANLEFRPINLRASATNAERDPQVVAASMEEASETNELRSGESAEDESPENPIAESSKTPSEVLIRGEVVENETGGPPRIMVDIVTAVSKSDAAGDAGQVSLIVAAGGDGRPWENFGRWDFRAADAETVFHDDLQQPAMRFFLELPEGVPSDVPVELWTRMVSKDGQRMVTHVPLNLREPGKFTSIPADVAPHDGDMDDVSRPSTIDVVYRDVVQPANYVAPEPSDGGWTIARPWEPADAEAEEDEQTAEWRAATEMPPEAIATTPNHSQRARNRPAKPARKFWNDEERPPSWSPDRSGKPLADGRELAPASTNSLRTARPSWAAER